MKIKLTLLIFFFISIANYAQINTERYRLDSDSIGITGIADIELTAITGNTNLQIIHLGGRLNYNWGSSYTFFVADGGFGWDDGERIFNQTLFHLRHVQTINELMQAEGFTQFDFNKSRLLDERELVGLGLRFKILTYNDFKLRIGTSYFYEHEKFDLPDYSKHGSNLYTNRFSTYLTFEYDIKDKVKLISITYYQPQINHFKDFRILSDNSLFVGLSSFVDLKTSFSLRFDAKPPETIKSIDTFTKFGFSFKF